jgi:cystathionine beta-lyase
MGKLDFDRIIRRIGTGSTKWDAMGIDGKSDDVLPFWVADMDFPSPEPVIAALKKAAEFGVFGYVTPGSGLFKAISGWFSRNYEWNIAKDDISFSPGVVTGMTIAIRAFTHPGDRIIVQPPAYFACYKVIEENGCFVEDNPLIESERGEYSIDYDDLEKKCSRPDIKLLMLLNPHNPVGKKWKREELEKVGQICRRHGVIVLSDEIHCDLTFNGNYFPFQCLSEEVAQNCVTFVAPSKTFNLAGLRTSLVISRNKKLLSEYNLMLDRHHVRGMNLMGVAAMEAAYTGGDEYRRELLRYLWGNIQFVSEFLKTRVPEIKMVRHDATYLLWLDCRGLKLSRQELDDLFIKKARVLLNSGYKFGAGGDGFMRMNVACPREVLQQGLVRIENVIRQSK